MPIYIESSQWMPNKINEFIYLINEKGNVLAYNTRMKRFGNLSPKTFSNKKYQGNNGNNVITGKVWAIYGNKILVEIM